jgi:hypothetical protein
VESEALIRAFRGWLSSSTDFTIELAAVGVSVKGMIRRVLLTSWRLAESYGSDDIDELISKNASTNNIREDDRLEVHDAVLVSSFVSFIIDSFVERLKS